MRVFLTTDTYVVKRDFYVFRVEDKVSGNSSNFTIPSYLVEDSNIRNQPYRYMTPYLKSIVAELVEKELRYLRDDLPF